MLVVKFRCPSCATTFKPAKPIPSGTQVKCPKCAKPFLVVAEGASATPAAAAPRPSQVKTNTDAAAPRPSQVKLDAVTSARQSQVKVESVSNANAGNAPSGAQPGAPRSRKLKLVVATGVAACLLVAIGVAYLRWGTAETTTNGSEAQVTRSEPPTNNRPSEKAGRTDSVVEPAQPLVKPKPVIDLTAFAAPDLPGGKLEVKLPEPFVNIASGGAGRYLIFHFKNARKLGVFDLSKAAIVKEISVSSDQVLIAAGLDKLMVVLPADKVIQKWDLTTFERDKTVPIPDELTVRNLAMGSASRGPLLLWGTTQGILFDIESMKRLDVPGPRLTGDERFGLNLRASADGTRFLGYVDANSGSRPYTMRVRDKTELFEGPQGFHGVQSMYVTDAGLIFIHGNVLTDEFQPIETKWLSHFFAQPTEDARFFIGVKGPGGDAAEVAVCTSNDRRIVHTVKGFPEMPIPRYDNGMKCFDNGEPRVRYVPGAKLLVLHPDQQRVLIRRLDIFEELAKASKDYLVVTSLPPRRVPAGATYTYPIQVRSGSQGLKYKLESGPEGMTVSPDGLVRWQTPAVIDAKAERVIVSISNSAGTENIHSFEVVRSAPEGAAPVAVEVPPAGPGSNPRVPPPERVASGPFARLPLEDPAQLSPGHDWKSMLLLQRDQLSILKADGSAVDCVLHLGHHYRRVLDRADYYVALSDDPDFIDLIDKKTLKASKRIDLSPLSKYMRCEDLVLHPTLPLSYVAMTIDIKVPRSRVVVVNETTGAIERPEDIFGNFLAIDPAGQFLYVGYKDLTDKGFSLRINPNGQIIRIPEYGSIDKLLVCQLDNGMPKLRQLVNKAGGNGTGIRLSPDGARLTYLSVVGYPEFSGNLGLWNPRDLEQPPVTVTAKDVGGTQALAFHPMLKLMATPSPRAPAAVFDRESGKLLENRLEIPNDLSELRANQIYFTADGKHLLLDGTLPSSGRFLQRLSLRLNEDERAVVERGYVRPEPVAVKPPSRPVEPVIRAEPPRAAGLDDAVKQATEWIAANNAFGPEHKIVKDVAAKIAAARDRDKGILLALGDGLVKSGKPTYLAVRDAGFVALEMTPEQAALSKFPKFAMVETLTQHDDGPRSATPAANLLSLKIDQADKLPANAKITGEVAFKLPENTKGYFALRLYCIAGGNNHTLYHHRLGDYLIGDKKPMPFSFPAINTGHRGPAVVFIDLVSFPTSARNGNLVVARSKLLAQIVTFADP